MEKGDQGHGATSRRWETSAGCKFPVPGGTRVLPKCEPSQAAGSCHAWSSRQPCTRCPVAPYPPRLACLCRPPPPTPPPPCPWRAHTPCSSLLRNLFHFLKPGSSWATSRYVLGQGGQTHASVNTAHTHKCVSLACTHGHTHSVPALSRLPVRTKRALHKNGHPLSTCTVASTAQEPRALGCQSSPSTVGAGPCMFSKHLGVPGAGDHACL